MKGKSKSNLRINRNESNEGEHEKWGKLARSEIFSKDPAGSAIKSFINFFL